MKGYTLLEVMIIMGILGILGSIGTLNIYTFRTEETLDLIAQGLLDDLRSAQQKSITQELGEQWGVHLDASAAGNDSYQVFYGVNYSSGTIVKTVVLPANIQFIEPARGATKDISFAKVTGETPAGSAVINIVGTGNSDYIAISGLGVISVTVTPPPLDLSIFVSPTAGSVFQGNSVQTAVNVSLLSGASQLSNFSASNLPANATASFSPVSCAPTCSTTMIISTAAATPAGTNLVTVTVASGDLTKNVTYALTVDAPTTPSEPAGLKVSPSNNQNTLSWQAPASNGGSSITNYKVYRGSMPGGETFLVDAGNVLSYSNTGPVNGTVYYYQVSAVNGVGEGLKSSEASGAPNPNVSGWAWSSNIGWISFNCVNNNSCGQSNYAINIDPGTGLFSGYAWSENIGWLSFNASDLSGCPSGTCEARVSGGLISGSFPKSVTGWAKALSFGEWLHLRDAPYGVQLESNGDFSGWSWGDSVIGWTHWSDLLYRVRVSF